MRITVPVRLLRPGAVLPAYATDGAAGMDLFACIKLPLRLYTGERVAVPTGIALELPPGHAASVLPRSGLALRCGVTVLNAPGTIDEDYRGEVHVLLINHGAAEHVVRPGDRIAQLVVTRVERCAVVEAQELGDTERGAGGFGSTGR